MVKSEATTEIQAADPAMTVISRTYKEHTMADVTADMDDEQALSPGRSISPAATESHYWRSGRQ
jgi:hypothetical protein